MTYLLSWIVNPVYCDGPEPWQIGFQDSASPVHEGITDLHNEIFFYLIVIAVGVAWVLGSIVVDYYQNKSPIVYKYANYGLFRFFINLIFSITILGGFSNVTSVYSIRLSAITFLFLTYRWNKSKAIELFLYLAIFVTLGLLYYIDYLFLGIFVDHTQPVISVGLDINSFWAYDPIEDLRNKPRTGFLILAAGGALPAFAKHPGMQFRGFGVGTLGARLIEEVVKKPGSTGGLAKVVGNYSSNKSFSNSNSDSNRPREKTSSNVEDLKFSSGGTNLREDFPIQSPLEGDYDWLTFLFDLVPRLKQRLATRLPLIVDGMDFGHYTEQFAQVNVIALVTTFQAYLVFMGVIIVCLYTLSTQFNKYILAKLEHHPKLLRYYGFIIKVREIVVLFDLLFLLINSYYVIKGCSFITDNYIPQDVGPLYDEYLKNKK